MDRLAQRLCERQSVDDLSEVLVRRVRQIPSDAFERGHRMLNCAGAIWLRAPRYIFQRFPYLAGRRVSSGSPKPEISGKLASQARHNI